MSIVITSAFAPELAPYHDGDAPAPPGGALSLAGIAARGVAVGIGLVAASRGAARLVDGDDVPSLVVFSGTCGAYSSALAVLDVVVVERASLLEPLVLEGRVRFPEGFSPPLTSHAPAVASLVAAGARAVDAATTLGITLDAALGRRIAETTGALVEHMEAYAVAAACAERGVPFVAVLGVANHTGPDAHPEWRQHHREASRRAAAVVVRAASRLLASELRLSSV